MYPLPKEIIQLREIILKDYVRYHLRMYYTRIVSYNCSNKGNYPKLSNYLFQ